MEIVIAVGIGVFCVFLDKILDLVIVHYRNRREQTSQKSREDAKRISGTGPESALPPAAKSA
jgi:hypothetical protein